MQYAETRWQELKAQIDAIDSIPELQEKIQQTYERIQQFDLGYEPSNILSKSLNRMTKRLSILNRMH